MSVVSNQQAEIKPHIFEKISIMKTTMDKMMAFHKAPEALPTLTPPPIFVQLHRDERTSLTGGELEFTLWFGPIPIRWVARHEEGPTETSFVDYQVSGPMAHWRHEHIFEEVDGGIKLIDRIAIAHKPGLTGLLTRLVFDGMPLHIFFFYRHLRTRLAVK